MPKHLHKGDETARRWKIIDASRGADASLLPQLLARLDTETNDNKRHIVRALGNIGGPKAERRLLEILNTHQGLILGDVAGALGKLGCRQAVPALKRLRDHESEWVRQNANGALRSLTSGS